MTILNTFTSEYGTFTLLEGEEFVAKPFKEGGHWEQDFIQQMIPLIPPSRNILEIGSHVGTHTIPYSRATNGFLYSFEPQKTLYHLLKWNVRQNKIKNIVPHNAAVSYFNGKTHMCSYFPDGVGYKSSIDYREAGNFGGVTLGATGEEINCITLDSLEYENIGFFHMDAQGAEPLVFYAGEKFIKQNKPIICFENNKGSYLEEIIKSEIEIPENIINYDVIAFCEAIGYHTEVICDMVTLFPPKE